MGLWTEGEGSAQLTSRQIGRGNFHLRPDLASSAPPSSPSVLDPSLPSPLADIIAHDLQKGEQTDADVDCSACVCLFFTLVLSEGSFLSFLPYPTFRSIEREKFETRRLFVRGQNLNAAAARRGATAEEGATVPKRLCSSSCSLSLSLSAAVK